MFCKKCGNQIVKGAAFCNKCGTPAEKNGNAAQQGGITLGQNPGIFKMGILAAGVLMAIATALPYYVFNSEVARYTGMKSVSLLKAGNQMGDGIIYIILAALVILFTFLEKRIPALALGVLPCLMYFVELSQMKKQFGTLLGSIANLYDIISRGIGFYLLTISVFGMLALCVLAFLQSRKTDVRKA